MLGKLATLILRLDGRMIIRYEGRDLRFREIAKWPQRMPAVPGVWPKPPKYNPLLTHPWKVCREPAESDVAGSPSVKATKEEFVLSWTGNNHVGLATAVESLTIPE